MAVMSCGHGLITLLDAASISAHMLRVENHVCPNQVIWVFAVPRRRDNTFRKSRGSNVVRVGTVSRRALSHGLHGAVALSVTRNPPLVGQAFFSRYSIVKPATFGTPTLR